MWLLTPRFIIYLGSRSDVFRIKVSASGQSSVTADWQTAFFRCCLPTILEIVPGFWTSVRGCKNARHKQSSRMRSGGTLQGSQLRVLDGACTWTFLSRGQILQTWTAFYESQFFWNTCLLVYSKLPLSSVMKRSRGWYLRWCQPSGQDLAALAPEHNRKRPQRSWRLCETLPHRIQDDMVFISTTWQLILFFYSSLELLFGTDAFKLPCIPDCLHRLSWLPSQRRAPAYIGPWGGSDPWSVWSTKRKTSVYKLSLSALVLPSIN